MSQPVTPCPQCGAPAERSQHPAGVEPSGVFAYSWRFDLHAAIRERVEALTAKEWIAFGEACVHGRLDFERARAALLRVLTEGEK